MRKLRSNLMLLAALLLSNPVRADDPYLWLEEVKSDRALAWVNAHNAQSTKSLQSLPTYEPIRRELLEVLTSKERIPGITKYGPHLYNFWRDDKNPRGLWRRTTLDEYKKPAPAWETVLDLDALAAAEKENWVWSGADVLELPNTPPTRVLIDLSRGGGDAHVMREFDLSTKRFLDNGFTLPEGKHRVTWGDLDTLYVGTDYGPDSLTPSGYPRIIKKWTRNTPLASATTVFEGEKTDMSVGVNGYLDHGVYCVLLTRSPTFFTTEQFLRRDDKWLKIDKPDDASASTWNNKLLLRLRTDRSIGGKPFKAGSLLVADFEKFLAGDHTLVELFIPTERTALASVSSTKNFLLLNTMNNVSNRIFALQENQLSPGAWEKHTLDVAELSTASASGLDSEKSDAVLRTTSGFLNPSALAIEDLATPLVKPQTLKQLPAFFNADNLEVTQFQSTSKDGTKIPYFLVSKKNLPLNGSTSTLLYGYGGFQISMLPAYSPEIGRAWLARGGAYVVANIRGGGEFGPSWHFAARKENRQRAYDDFISVAEDLHARKITSPKKLAVSGRSNGGLLAGVMLTERPDLFGAVIIGSPLLDMQRYTLLPAGASWIDEYGDPAKTEEWAYIAKYSPYQNIKPAATTPYPQILITTSTLDDRVHPGHARKFAARLEELGHPVLYFENTEGGHAAAANQEQQALMRALEYTFLWRALGS